METRSPEAAVEELRYEMIMALNAADFGSPICEQAAAICAEIADQHCARLHRNTQVAPVITLSGTGSPR
jgi:hypothetical protein